MSFNTFSNFCATEIQSSLCKPYCLCQNLRCSRTRRGIISQNYFVNREKPNGDLNQNKFSGRQKPNTTQRVLRVINGSSKRFCSNWTSHKSLQECAKPSVWKTVVKRHKHRSHNAKLALKGIRRMHLNNKSIDTCVRKNKSQWKSVVPKAS